MDVDVKLLNALANPDKVALEWVKRTLVLQRLSCLSDHNLLRDLR